MIRGSEAMLYMISVRLVLGENLHTKMLNHPPIRIRPIIWSLYKVLRMRLNLHFKGLTAQGMSI